jgi:hypothetical protein
MFSAGLTKSLVFEILGVQELRNKALKSRCHRALGSLWELLRARSSQSSVAVIARFSLPHSKRIRFGALARTKEAGSAQQFANAIYAPAAPARSSAGYVGQIMRRFFLSSGTQLKSGATQSLQNDHHLASDTASGRSVQGWEFKANHGEGRAIGPRSDYRRAK